MSGEELLQKLSALANPHRVRILAALLDQRNYVSQLARELRMSRPLLHLHLQKLEAAGLVEGALELSDDGKAMKYYAITPFDISLTPQIVAHAARSVEPDGSDSRHKSNSSQRRKK